MTALSRELTKSGFSAAQSVANYYKTAPTGMASFLANHDSFAGTRIWNQLSGDVAQYKLAAATYLLLPGTPFIYYGEEVGMASSTAANADVAQRDPMSWTASSSNAGFTTGTPYRALASNVASQNAAAAAGDPASLLNFYKAMLALRNTVPALAVGDYTQAQANGNLLQFQRSTTGSSALVLINYGNSAATAAVTLSANANLHALYPTGGTDAVANSSGQASVSVPAQSLLVYQITP